MYIYEPPKRWTEVLFNEVSDEDNRFEFKRGDQWTSDINEFEKTLAKEICALANSFGGTLFLGVADKTKEIVGVPKNGKGSASAKAWIESIIPNLLEFRLPNFRVLEVGLTLKTKAKIGKDKTVISIDVYDSDLAPHRSIKHNNYFYRQGSMSVPAPHHYLAYLWGRSSPNMSNVVNTWFKIYVNNLILLLEKTAKNFEENKFNTIDEKIGESRVLNREIVFFENAKWKGLNSSLTAKQFLRTFPDISFKVNELNTPIDNFFNYIIELKGMIESSPEFEKTIRKLYDEAMYREGFKQSHQFDDKSLEDIIRLYAGQVFERDLPGISEYSAELKEILIRMTAYNLLKPDSSSLLNNSTFFNFCKENIANQFNESKTKIDTVLPKIIGIQNEIAQKADSLAKQFDELRYALALKHNTTYE